MGSDKAKLEKKRLKAQVKVDKARAKSAMLPPESSPVSGKVPWHKDPNWVRAIIAIASFVVMVITLIIMVM